MSDNCSEHNQNNNLRIFENIIPIAVCIEDTETIINQNKNRRRVNCYKFF